MVPCFSLSWSEVVEQHIPTRDSHPIGQKPVFMATSIQVSVNKAMRQLVLYSFGPHRQSPSALL